LWNRLVIARNSSAVALDRFARRTRESFSLRATVTACVIVSPVSSARRWASLWASGSLIFKLIIYLSTILSTWVDSTSPALKQQAHPIRTSASEQEEIVAPGKGTMTIVGGSR